MTGRHQNRRGEGAQSVVETALVLPFLIVLATALGFLIGIARLSPNWLVARLAAEAGLLSS